MPRPAPECAKDFCTATLSGWSGGASMRQSPGLGWTIPPRQSAFDEFDGKLSDPLINAGGLCFFVRVAGRALRRAQRPPAPWRFQRGSRLRSESGLVEVEDRGGGRLRPRVGRR